MDMEKISWEEIMKVGLKSKDALCRSKWSVGVSKIVAGLW